MKSVAAIMCAGALIGWTDSPVAAPIYTNEIHTVNELSYDFSGSGQNELISAVSRTTASWDWINATAAQNRFAWVIAAWYKHVAAGPFLVLASGAQTYGATYDGFVTLAHDTGFDNFSLRVTVQNSGNDTIGDFDGRFSLIHRGRSVPVPSTLALLGIALAGMRISRLRR